MPETSGGRWTTSASRSPALSGLPAAFPDGAAALPRATRDEGFMLKRPT